MTKMPLPGPDHTHDHLDCPACEAARIEIMGLDGAIRSLSYDQAQRIKELSRRSGIYPTRIVDEALDVFERALDAQSADKYPGTG